MVMGRVVEWLVQDASTTTTPWGNRKAAVCFWISLHRHLHSPGLLELVSMLKSWRRGCNREQRNVSELIKHCRDKSTCLKLHGV